MFKFFQFCCFFKKIVILSLLLQINFLKVKFMDDFIKVLGVYFSYSGEENEFVLKDISFNIRKGQKVAIVGSNGSGKSTLSKILNAIFLPTKGNVFVDSFDCSKKEFIVEIRKNVGLIFQDPDNQIVATTVEEDVAFALENLCVPQEKMCLIIKKVLDSVRMGKFRKKNVEELSGGQKSKVAIAGILAMDPKCIIFDESTAMLDPKSRKEILNIMEELNKKRGTTIINITHNMDEVTFFDSVIVLKDGKVLKQDTPRNIFLDESVLKEAGLCLPQVAKLISMLYEEGLIKQKIALSVDECVFILANSLKGEKNF